MCGAIEGCVDQQKGPCSNKKKNVWSNIRVYGVVEGYIEQLKGVWSSTRVHGAIQGCKEQYKGVWSNKRVCGANEGCIER